MDEPILSTATPPADPIPAAPPSDPVIPTDPPVQTPPNDPAPSDPAPPQTIKIKYNHEDKEIPYDEAVQHIQKGLNYDKVYERYNELANHPGLTYLNEIAQANGVTVDQLVGHWKQQNEQAKLDELIQNNIPEDVAREIIEGRKFRQQYTQEKMTAEQQRKQQGMYVEFMEKFPEVKPEDVPAEVWQEVNSGKALVDAYTRHENQALKDRLAKMEETLQTRQKNDQNAQSTPGSVTGKGNVPTGYYSKEQVEKMDPKDAAKPEVYKAIMDSMKHWK